MSIILFAIIGSWFEAPVSYWVAFGLYAAFKMTVYFAKLSKAVSDLEDDK